MHQELRFGQNNSRVLVMEILHGYIPETMMSMEMCGRIERIQVEAKEVTLGAKITGIDEGYIQFQRLSSQPRSSDFEGICPENRKPLNHVALSASQDDLLAYRPSSH